MSISQIDLGDSVLLEGRYTNDSGVLSNPTTAELVVTSPAGVATTYPQAALTHVGTGIFTYSLVPASTGVWTFTFSGTGATPTVATGYFIVGGSARNTVCSPYATVVDLDGCHTSDATEGLKEDALAAASDLLWRWTGYKFPGLCRDKVRPCAQNSYLQGPGPNSMYSYGWGYGGWWSWLPVWGSCACNASPHRACGCTMLSEVQLGRSPIAGILAVKVDGVALIQGVDYRLDDNGWLVRLGEGNQWPCCQNLLLDDTNQDTWSVEFVWGRTPPPSAVPACVDLAWEMIQACPTGDCGPQPNTGSITRQGTQMTFIAPERFGLDSFDNLRFGIPSVDRFIAAMGHHRPGLIVSPDIDAEVRRVAT